MSDGCEFHLIIDVIVTGHTDGIRLAPLINDAMLELVNRRDFRTGTIEPGRAILHMHDHDSVRVAVNVARLNIGPT